MSAPTEEAAGRTRTAAIVATSVAVLLLAVAVVCLLGLHAACTTAVPPPLDDAPAPGTPRAAYCGAAGPRHRRLAVLGAAVTAAVLLAGLLVAGELEAGVTV